MSPVPVVRDEVLERTYRLPHRRWAAKMARELVRSFIAEFGLNIDLGNAMLLVSELVGNAFRHSSGHDGHLLTLKFVGVGLFMEVTDDSPQRPTAPVDPDPLAEDKRGVRLLLDLGEGFLVVPLGPRRKAVSVVAPVVSRSQNAVLTVEAVKAA